MITRQQYVLRKLRTLALRIFSYLDNNGTAGFVMTKVMRKGLEVRPYKPWMDNFQYANYVAVSRRIVPELQ